MISMNGVAGIPRLDGGIHELLGKFWASPEARGDVHLETFARWLRDQPFMFDACDPAARPADLFTSNFEAAFAVGARSISLGIAVVMHLYMLSAVATYPTAATTVQRRQEFLAAVLAHRWLVANSGADAQAHTTTAEIDAGRVRIEGRKRFVSLATVADLLIFTAIEKRSGASLALFAPMRSPGLQLLESPFPPFLAHTGTCSVLFAGLDLPLSHIVSGAAEVGFEQGHAFQRMWFSALIPAVYLGAATAALHEAKATVSSIHTEGGAMVSLDGVSVEFGRLVLMLASCLLGVAALERSLERACSVDASPTDRAAAADRAGAFKYSCMRTVCTVACELRTLLGTRSLAPASRLLQFSLESMAGPLHPEAESMIERRLGNAFLQA